MDVSPWNPHASPLTPLLGVLISSVENIAPEKAGELRKLAPRVKFIVDDHPGFVFRTRGKTDPREVRSSIVGLELLWSLTYGHTAIYQAPKHRGAIEMSFGAAPETAAAAEMLAFAFRDRLGPQPPKYAFPTGLPRPTFADLGNVSAAGTLELATELFACGVAWILHHELAHVDLGHLDTSLPEMRDELDADQGATTWLLDGVRDPLLILKRGLGVAIGVIALGAVALANPGPVVAGKHYPPAGERIMRALTHNAFGEDHQVHDFACLALKVHLDHRQIPVVAGPFDRAFDCLHQYCRDLITYELGR